MNGTLDKERRAVVRAIEEGHGTRAWHWERDAAAGPYSSEEICLRHAEYSDGLFLILADELTEITRREYQAAKGAGAATFILVKEGVDRLPEVRSFIDAERRHVVTGSFRNLKELRDRVRQSIDFHSAQAWRATQLDRRERNFIRELDSAWRLNERALQLAERGRETEALAEWRHMEAIGLKLGDQYVVSTARHNYGAQAQLRGDYPEAKRWYIETLRSKLAMRDDLAAMQILLNLAGIAEQEGELEYAERLLRDIEIELKARGEPELLGTLYGNFGALAGRHRDLRTAEKYFRRALYYAQRSGRPGHMIVSMRNLGLVLVEQGRHQVALRWFQKALNLAEERGLTPHVQACHRHVAATLHLLGKKLDALRELERVSVVAQRAGDRRDMAIAMFEMGMVSTELGHAEEGRVRLDAALTAFREIGQIDWERKVLRWLLETDRVLSDSGSVERHLEDLLALVPRAARAERADILKSAGRALVVSGGDKRLARKYYARALASMEKYLSLEDVAWEYTLAGATLSQNGAPDSSLRFFNRAQALYREMQNGAMECHVINDRGNALVALGNHQEAVKDFTACLEIANAIGDVKHQFSARLNLAETARRVGDAGHAVAELRDLADWLAANGALSMVADLQRNLGAALVDLGELNAAADVYSAMRRSSREAGSPQLESHALMQLGWIESRRGRLGRAANYYVRAAKMLDEAADSADKLECLASLVEVESARGREEQTGSALQELVNIVGRSGGGDAVWQRLAAAARYWARRDEFESAAELFALSIVLATSGGQHSDEELIRCLAKPLIFLALAVREDQVDHSRMYDAVIHEASKLFNADLRFLRSHLDEISRGLPSPQDLL